MPCYELRGIETTRDEGKTKKRAIVRDRETGCYSTFDLVEGENVISQVCKKLGIKENELVIAKHLLATKHEWERW